MTENIEIEFKNILSFAEFELLKSFFNIGPEDFSTQVNHYFDTPSFSLKNHGCALRIRQKAQCLELTLKQPAEIGLLETNQKIDEAAMMIMKESSILPEGPVKEGVSRLVTNPVELSCFGSLATERAEKAYEGGLIVLDHSTYLNSEDYEIEYEVTDEKRGFEIFRELLETLKIPMRKTDNKIKRFYKQKYSDLRQQDKIL
ncbi:CYTH domain-containing protein [Mesobacillus zeae]|uniref:CYTH domain-containing protein n=1 Tax=Mesobacillus zeae TaxID=1917180 RepID=A0A398AWS2_9BACI|nr:CYTH domain-containing protein [Mesobacillus zeae]RID82045.1 CYTH domain-containing protein [Mesobacillus zeae]